VLNDDAVMLLDLRLGSCDFFYLRQGGNVFAGLCLFVCLSVCVLAR